MSTRVTAALAALWALGASGAPLAASATVQSAAAAVSDEAATPGAELRAWLVTIGPGEAVWERFGHNAIRVLDTSTGRDVSYNWGIFDFNQVDFIPRFLRGDMLYMMAAYPTAPMIDGYARSGREVVFQELDLTPAEKHELYELAEVNALPANREYGYDYFVDNCSTRVRDLLDRVMGGALSERFRTEPGTTYRWHTRRLTRVDPALFTGMDLLLGPPGDDPISVWDEMFLPMSVRDAVREVSRPGANGVGRPLVLSEEVVLAGIEEPREPPRWLGFYLLLGLALGGGLAGAGRAAAAGSRLGALALAVAGGTWSLLGGVIGVLLVAVLFTDHWSMAWNTNLLLLNPLHLALAVLVPLAAAGRARLRAERVALAALWISAVGLVVALLPVQSNGIFVAWALPTQAGLWWALTQLSGAGEEVGGRR